MFRPLLPPPKIDPQELIREIEDEPLSQFVWDLIPAISKAVHKFSVMTGQSFAKPSQSDERNPCSPSKA